MFRICDLPRRQFKARRSPPRSPVGAGPHRVTGAREDLSYMTDDTTMQTLKERFVRAYELQQGIVLDEPQFEEVAQNGNSIAYALLRTAWGRDPTEQELDMLFEHYIEHFWVDRVGER